MEKINKKENQDLKIVYKGKMFEVVTFSPKEGVVFETAVRAPGVRLLIEHEENGELGLIMTRELRHFKSGSMWDYRLPGGKVYDSLEEFNKEKENNGDVKEHAIRAAKLEARQEAGVLDGDFSPIGVSVAGGSVEWDLHYFLIKNAKLGDQDLEEHEKGEIEVKFMTAKEIFENLKNGEIREGRSADKIWEWLEKNNFLKFSK